MKFPAEPGQRKFNEFSVDYETLNFCLNYEMSMNSQGKFYIEITNRAMKIP